MQRLVCFLVQLPPQAYLEVQLNSIHTIKERIFKFNTRGGGGGGGGGWGGGGGESNYIMNGFIPVSFVQI